MAVFSNMLMECNISTDSCFKSAFVHCTAASAASRCLTSLVHGVGGEQVLDEPLHVGAAPPPHLQHLLVIRRRVVTVVLSDAHVGDERHGEDLDAAVTRHRRFRCRAHACNRCVRVAASACVRCQHPSDMGTYRRVVSSSIL